MKEIVKVNIAGIAFTFDDDAYNELDSYLNRLENGYKNSPEGEEVIADIEARIAEIILSHQDSSRVVGLELVRSVVAQMGLPDEIAGEGAAAAAADPGERFPRRLYRDREKARIGGVCSGLAAFFNTDPVWIRLGFFAPLILLIVAAPILQHHGSTFLGFLGATFGAFFLIYFILWFAIPVARNPRQRLEMRGERITAESIHRNIKDDLTARVDPKHSVRSASVLADLIYAVGAILLFIIKMVAVIIGFIVAIVTIALFFCGVAILFSISGPIQIKGMYITDPQLLTTGGLAILCVALPLAILVFFMVRALLNTHKGVRVLSVLSGVWIILLIFTGIMTIKNFDKIRGFAKSDYSTEILFRDNSVLPAADPRLGDSLPRRDTTIVDGDTVIVTREIVDVKPKPKSKSKSKNKKR